MRRLNRYIGTTVINAILAVLLVIVGLVAIGTLVDELGDLRNNYNFTQALIYVAFTLPSKIYDNLPFAALVGCLIGLGVLAGSSELTVMRAAGISLWRIVGSVMRPTLGLVLISLALGEYITPVTDQIAASRKAVALDNKFALQATQGLWSREGNEVFHVNAALPNGVLYGLTRYRFDSDRNLLSASFVRRATFSKGSWLLEDKVETRFYEASTEVLKEELSRWETELVPSVLNVIVMRPGELSISNLYAYGSYLDRQKQRSDDYWLAFWEKLLQPFATFSLVLVAISFIFGPLRQVTMGFRIFSGVIVGIVFQISQKLLGPASLVFGFSPFLAVLIPITLCLGAGVVLLRRAA